ncbi:hypothetical protein [Pyrobaculum calidifontis]|uniref:Uncharacterized protein n=1 Tax=Pyrobaculum calidifontis (strain DSM 21063 / JCM 11548 / VA1) TaxID=410359 RepID=A3MVH2_PYRCJ|nr:hypothetical protein [Pyrobaculum calidifontis]ABO08639.1 hypothetical protein Pcal_1214 [Pyrobaculum calidifontis JCM 11548]
MEREVVVNRALEEFRERLLRWDELCEQLRELYYRYLDLAAFRSEKCYFPGRKCKRPWKREYDVGDLTLMWTYIMNTAPLCGKLIRALAEVEYEIRKRAIESLEKYGGVKKKVSPNGGREIIHIRLKKPVYGYLILWNDKLYTIWGEFDDLPKNGRLRVDEVGRRVTNVIEWYKRGEEVEVEVKEYDIDKEYERLWFEVPLSNNISKLLGGRDRAPIALFRNLGWLLSDDWRQLLGHTAGNFGQMTMRLFDWISLVKYKMTREFSPNVLLIFRFMVNRMTKTKNGENPIVKIRPIGTAVEAVQAAYELFGITLGKTEEVLARGYAVLGALKEEAFKRDGKVYVVDDVSAWIAFSNAAAVVVLGDGYVMPTEFRVVAKLSTNKTLAGETARVKELAKALGGTAVGREVRLQSWHMRLLLPISPMPSFEKATKLYKALVNYLAAVIVEINGTTYLLTHTRGGKFVIGKEKAKTLYETVERLKLRTKFEKNMIVLAYTQLKELAKRGFIVKFLNDMEKDAIREVKPVLPMPDLEEVRKVFEKIANVARISVGLYRGREYVYITLYDKSKVEEVAAMLKTVGIRFSLVRQEGLLLVRERRSVEIICKSILHLFPGRL